MNSLYYLTVVATFVNSLHYLTVAATCKLSNYLTVTATCEQSTIPDSDCYV